MHRNFSRKTTYTVSGLEAIFNPLILINAVIAFLLIEEQKVHNPETPFINIYQYPYE